MEEEIDSAKAARCVEGFQESFFQTHNCERPVGFSSKGQFRVPLIKDLKKTDSTSL